MQTLGISDKGDVDTTKPLLVPYAAKIHFSFPENDHILECTNLSKNVIRISALCKAVLIPEQRVKCVVVLLRAVFFFEQICSK